MPPHEHCSGKHFLDEETQWHLSPAIKDEYFEAVLIRVTISFRESNFKRKSISKKKS